MPPTDSGLNAMLEASRPVTDAQLAEDPQVSALLAEIGRGIAARPRLRLLGGGGRRRSVVAAAAAAAAVIAIPVAIVDRQDGRPDVQRVVTAPPTSTPAGPPLRTGRFEPLEDGPDHSEWLNLESPELPAAIEEFGSEFPLPPGQDWSFLQRPGLWRGQTQETSLRRGIAAQARCQWMRYWKVSGPSGREAARKMLVRTREWSVYHDWQWTDQTEFDTMLHQLEKDDDRLLRKQLDEFCDVRYYFGEVE
ncbi:hypothetical protein ABGB12_18560 [Actinocorallia sp. B10E7]|uniref:hypothetical protein n=1 Tax=Actinocorallia sp. B10E7 TaxID=3153558 RepID=UPI00325F937D